MSPEVGEAIARATRLDVGALVIRRRTAMPHQANRLYDIWADDQHLIAKEYLSDIERDGPANEYRALHLVRHLDVAPRPVFFDPSVGRVVVYAFLEGEMWDRRVPSAAELEALAEVWVDVQALPIDGVWMARGQAQHRPTLVARLSAPIERYASWAASRDATRRKAADVCVKALERGLADGLTLIPEVAPLSFCRSDPRFANIIARPDGRIGLVDWEDSGLRDPARELADLMHHPNQEDLLDSEGWRPFLDRYLPTRTVDHSFGERLRGYLALFPVFWLGMLLAEGMDRVESARLEGWLVNDLDPNLRLRRYIARGLAWPSLDPSDSLSDVADIAFF
ncbi:MAG: aminoglycoside phosphotransferase family protein [Chloroflexota bacterium]|nr:aminoglycoside phosphotransferase family protein [Chloroflexota bacterium]